MNASIELRASVCALVVACLALSIAWLAALAIQAMPSLGTSMTSSAGPSAEMAATPELIAQGQKFFGESCSHCHGDDARGDEGPDLHNLSISNARIATTIKKGVKGEMPTFAKKYDDQQIAALVGYLRTLR